MFRVAAFALLLALSVGCREPDAQPDIEATVDGRVAAVLTAVPTPTTMPTPDIGAIVEERVAAMLTAVPSPTTMPTPDIDKIVEGRVASMLATVPTPTTMPTPDIGAIVEDRLAAMLTAVPTPTATPDVGGTVQAQLAATLAAMPTPTASPTHGPTPTATPTLDEIVNRIKPAVVRVERHRRGGSGVIFDVDGGYSYIVTNNHVIGEVAIGLPIITVIVDNSTSYSAELLGYNRFVDLAVLRIPCRNCARAPIGRTSDARAGKEVIIIGYPVGSVTGDAIVTRGVVSAIGPLQGYEGGDTIQTDAAINPGNSGGPMLSLSGEVLGINTFKTVGTRIEGQGFAIPADKLREQIPQLRQGGIVDEIVLSDMQTGELTRTFEMPSGAKLTYSLTANKAINFSIHGPDGRELVSEDRTRSAEGTSTADMAGVHRLTWRVLSNGTTLKFKFDYDPIPEEISDTGVSG